MKECRKVTVVIVGAGIAGLTCGIALSRFADVHVTILEKAPDHANAGNGIQVPCNACQVLQSLGLLDKLVAKAGGVAQRSLTMDYEDGRVLLNRDFSNYEQIHGAPWLLVHRADYIEVLLEEAQKAGIDIRYGCRVQEVNFEHPFVRIEDEGIVRADVVVGSDGVSSSARNSLYPEIQPRTTDTFAYRGLIARERLPPQLLGNISGPSECRIWVGPSAHVVFYPLRGTEQYNLVVIIADSKLNSGCEGRDVLKAVGERMTGWNAVVRGLLAAAEELAPFPLWSVEPLPCFFKGSVALIGDAAHPTTPYLGQGAAMAVEDALILATLLGKLKDYPGIQDGASLKACIPLILGSYDALQRRRTNKIVAQAQKNGYFNHLPRGPGQRDRDAEYKASETEDSGGRCPWINSDFNRELLGRNAGNAAEQEFRRLVAQGSLDRLEENRDGGFSPEARL